MDPTRPGSLLLQSADGSLRIIPNRLPRKLPLRIATLDRRSWDMAHGAEFVLPKVWYELRGLRAGVPWYVEITVDLQAATPENA